MEELEDEIVRQQKNEIRGIFPTVDSEREVPIVPAEDVKDAWYNFREQSVLTEYPNPESEQDVIIQIKNISMDGHIFIEFN